MFNFSLRNKLLYRSCKMSSLGFIDMLKLAYNVIKFKFEQNKFTTNENAIVETTKGPIKGVKRMSVFGNAYYSFEQIPFAKPPIGELRFRAPVPAEPWKEVRNCTSPAETPLQSNFIFRKYKGSEDCLYLNVFTKNCNPEKPMPVMVWIYGGGFQIGEASRDLYSPDYLMSKDIVLVTVAYRLGPLGFLRLDDAELNIPGNAGLKDQILGIKWVKENCSRFGGDPENVTLFGESAGGASTHCIMLSEQSKGLIHKAIVMSGSAICPWALPPQKNWAYRLAKILGYTGDDKDNNVYSYLTNAKGPDIVKAAPTILEKDEKRHRILLAFGPVVEPYITEQCVIPEDPLEMIKKSWSNDIPLIIGGVSFEGLLFYPEMRRRPATLEEVGNCEHLLPLQLSKSVDEEKKKECALMLKKTFFEEDKCDRNTLMEFLDLLSCREFWHPIYRTAMLRLEYSKAPTYLYRFDYDSKDFNQIRNVLCGRNVRGTCHGDDLCYLFYSLITHKTTKDTPEYRVIATMIDVWTSFAAQSDPNCDMLKDVKFEPLSKTEATLKCLNISPDTQMKHLPDMQKLTVWDNFYPKEQS